MGDRSIDHQLPESRGGSDDLKNLVYACLPCNINKSDRTVQEFRALKDGIKFFAEREEGRQFVTRPSDPRVPNRHQQVTNKPAGATNSPKNPSQMSPEPAFEPSLTVHKDKDLIEFAIKESRRTKRDSDEILAELRAQA